MQKSIGVWVLGQLVMGGFPEPLVTVTWFLLAITVLSAGGAVGRLISPRVIGYGDGSTAVASTRGGLSGLMEIFSDIGCLLSQTSGSLTQGYNHSGSATIYLVGPGTTSTYAVTAAVA